MVEGATVRRDHVQGDAKLGIPACRAFRIALSISWIAHTPRRQTGRADEGAVRLPDWSRIKARPCLRPGPDNGSIGAMLLSFAYLAFMAVLRLLAGGRASASPACSSGSAFS